VSIEKQPRIAKVFIGLLLGFASVLVLGGVGGSWRVGIPWLVYPAAWLGAFALGYRSTNRLLHWLDEAT